MDNMLKQFKNRLLIIFFAIGGFLGTTQASFLGENFNILQLQPTIENILKLKDATIETQLPFGLMKEALKKVCSPSSIYKGKLDLKMIVPLRYNGFLKNRSMFSLQYDYQDLLRLFLAIPSDDADQYCSRKYLMLSLLKRTHSYFHLSKDKPIGENIYSTLTPAQQLVNITHHDEQLNTPELEDFGELTENSVQTILGNLENKGILTDQDLKNLDNKIEVFYVPSCEISKGSFHILEDSLSKDTRFKEIKLYISTCNPLPNAVQLFSYIEHVLVHELGHYIYFFKDPKAKLFTQICWKEGQSTCKLQDFHSLYAETNKEEDYAESFAYWYQYQSKTTGDSDALEHGSAASERISLKEQHFSHLFQ
ncbi:MAG: hypothetical protein HG424_001365 [candidate division SR1 bacterium]|nr:hypothetical protein [candidate division SR1 bacterium]